MNRLGYLLGAILGISIVLPVHAADLAVPPRGMRATTPQPLAAAVPDVCTRFRVDPKASDPIRAVTLPPSGTCKPVMKNGLPIPDPTCSPGAINPTLTLAVLKAKGFTTDCVRDRATSATEKQKTYDFYKIEKPAHNKGPAQVCELDHIISLELGGADTLENLWPQCGPNKVALAKRFFKQKDAVENFLNREVKAGRIDLSAAQRGIAEDWTQFLAAAKKAGVK
jgi:hypothetical protein